MTKQETLKDDNKNQLMICENAATCTYPRTCGEKERHKWEKSCDLACPYDQKSKCILCKKKEGK